MRTCKVGNDHPAAPGRSMCYPHYRQHRQGIIEAVAPSGLLTGLFNVDPLPLSPQVRKPQGDGFLSTISWDLETTNLSAIMGRVLACSFHDVETDEVWTFRADDPEFLNPDDPIDDSKLVVAIRDQIEQYDVWLTWNGLLFDMKMLKARLFKAGERMPEARWHVDGMWIIRSNFKVSSKLDNVAKYLSLPEQKTPILWEDWQRAMAGHRASMDQVVEHCEADVRTTTATLRKLRPYIKQLQRRG